MYNYCFLEENEYNTGYKKNGNIRTWGTSDMLVVTEETNFNLPEGGNFAVAADFYSSVILVCDYICSIPLFYSIKNDKIYVSTNSINISDIAGIPLEKENEQEFLCTGYVTQEKTLFKDILQVMPGQLVKIYKSDGKVICKNYFNFDYDFSSSLTKKQLIEEYDKVLFDVFGNLVKRLDGRTALIPLSGGCDSRTIAVMFKRLEYKNVICFSYGRKGSHDIEVSEKTAKALGFEWHCVEYNAEIWKKFYNSEDYSSFLKYSCKGAGIGCIQALLAVLELKNQGGGITGRFSSSARTYTRFYCWRAYSVL